MVIIENKVIRNLSYDEIKSYESVIIRDCIIDTINFEFSEVFVSIFLESCVIKDLLINTCWFKRKTVIDKCIFKNDIVYEMGGHNDDEIYIKNNVFCGFFDFFDCQFNKKVFIENNVFVNGANLLGNREKGYKNIFNNGIILSNNNGDLEINN